MITWHTAPCAANERPDERPHLRRDWARPSHICAEPAGLTGDDFVSIRVVECDGINNVLVSLQHMPVTAAPPTCAVCPRSSEESTGMPIALDHGACHAACRTPYATWHAIILYRESHSARDTTRGMQYGYRESHSARDTTRGMQYSYRESHSARDTTRGMQLYLPGISLRSRYDTPRCLARAHESHARKRARMLALRYACTALDSRWALAGLIVCAMPCMRRLQD
jgi:hypothetical protein